MHPRREPFSLPAACARSRPRPRRHRRPRRGYRAMVSGRRYACADRHRPAGADRRPAPALHRLQLGRKRRYLGLRRGQAGLQTGRAALSWSVAAAQRGVIALQAPASGLQELAQALQPSGASDSAARSRCSPSRFIDHGAMARASASRRSCGMMPLVVRGELPLFHRSLRLPQRHPAGRRIRPRPGCVAALAGWRRCSGLRQLLVQRGDGAAVALGQGGDPASCLRARSARLILRLELRPGLVPVAPRSRAWFRRRRPAAGSAPARGESGSAAALGAIEHHLLRIAASASRLLPGPAIVAAARLASDNAASAGPAPQERVVLARRRLSASAASPARRLGLSAVCACSADLHQRATACAAHLPDDPWSFFALVPDVLVLVSASIFSW